MRSATDNELFKNGKNVKVPSGTAICLRTYKLDYKLDFDTFGGHSTDSP